LWFEDLADPKLATALKEVGAAYVPPIMLNPPMLAGAGAEMFDIVLRMDGLKSFAQEWNQSKLIDLQGVPVKILPLDRILASKRAANRAKDKLVIHMLEDVLNCRKRNFAN
jgi:hypothetical protein